MSDFVVHKGTRTAGTFARHYGADVAEVHYEHETRTGIVLADGRSGAGSCIGCGSAPCMEKDDSELTLFGALMLFPATPAAMFARQEQFVGTAKPPPLMSSQMIASAAACASSDAPTAQSACPMA